MITIVNKTKSTLHISTYSIAPLDSLKLQSIEIGAGIKQQIKNLVNMGYVDTFDEPDEVITEQPKVETIQEPEVVTEVQEEKPTRRKTKKQEVDQ